MRRLVIFCEQYGIAPTGLRLGNDLQVFARSLDNLCRGLFFTQDNV